MVERFISIEQVGRSMLSTSTFFFPSPPVFMAGPFFVFPLLPSAFQTGDVSKRQASSITICVLGRNPTLT